MFKEVADGMMKTTLVPMSEMKKKMEEELANANKTASQHRQRIFDSFSVNLLYISYIVISTLLQRVLREQEYIYFLFLNSAYSNDFLDP